MARKVIKSSSILGHTRKNLNDNLLELYTADATLLTRISPAVQTLVATGAVTAGVKVLELSHTGTVIAAAMASAVNHPGFFAVVNTSASGTAAHTLTLTTGTLNGTNKIATLNAPGEALLIYFDAAGRGTIIANIGSVAISG